MSNQTKINNAALVNELLSGKKRLRAIVMGEDGSEKATHRISFSKTKMDDVYRATIWGREDPSPGTRNRTHIHIDLEVSDGLGDILHLLAAYVDEIAEIIVFEILPRDAIRVEERYEVSFAPISSGNRIA